MPGPNRHARPFHPSRSRGQCFLRDRGAVERIVAAVRPGPRDHFVEIGAGTGELTLPLLAAGGRRLIAIENDRTLLERLDRAIPEDARERVETLRQDFLRLDFPSFLDDRHIEKARVVGNLPYSMASPILLKLLEARERIADLTLLFQLEVAERLVARPGTKAYGALTVVVQQAARPRLRFRVPPQAFRPQPRVQSALVHLEPRGPDEPPVGDRRQFQALVKGLFAHRRKNISNNLKHLTSSGLDVASLQHGLDVLRIDPSRRAETLTVEEFAGLSHFCASPP